MKILHVKYQNGMQRTQGKQKVWTKQEIGLTKKLHVPGLMWENWILGSRRCWVLTSAHSGNFFYYFAFKF